MRVDGAGYVSVSTFLLSLWWVTMHMHGIPRNDAATGNFICGFSCFVEHTRSPQGEEENRGMNFRPCNPHAADHTRYEFNFHFCNITHAHSMDNLFFPQD
jgi:hypothetical protein